MEVRGRGFAVTAEGIKRGPVIVRYEDIITIKQIEGTSKFTVKSYNRPMYGNALGGVRVNVKLGNNMRISTGDRRNNRNQTTSVTLNVGEENIQNMNDAILAYLPSGHVEQRNIKYLEAHPGMIFLSALLLFAAIFLFIFGSSGSLSGIFTNPAVVFGGAAGIIVLSNVLCYIFTDKERQIKIYSQGGYY